MLHSAVKEAAAVGIGKVAAVCKAWVVIDGSALHTCGAECTVVPVFAVVIYIALKARLVELPIGGEVLPLWVKTVNGVVPESVVVGRENEIPHTHLVNAAKETAAKQQWLPGWDCEWSRERAALLVRIVYKQAYAVSFHQQCQV